MILSSQPCGACGSTTTVKNFRGSTVHVCQTCQHVTLSKSDFKQLITGRAPDSFSNDDVPLQTEITEEIDSHLVSTFAATEIDHTSAGMIAIDEPTRGAFDLANIRPGTPAGAQQREFGYVEDDFDAELDAYQAAKRRRAMGMVLGLGLVLFVLLGVAALAATFGIVLTVPETQTAAAPLPAPPAPVTPAAPTEPEPAAPAPVAPAPAAPASPKPAPAPQPVAAPAPPAPRPKPVPQGPAALVKAGWRAMDSDATQAEALFSQALATSPSHSEANYGYGYALLTRGAKQQAKPHLCKAAQSGDASTAREVRALLSKNALSCE